MNLSKYARNTQLVLAASQKIARMRQHQAIEPEHLLVALLDTDATTKVCEKLGTKVSELQTKMEVELTKLTKVAGASNYLGPRFLKVTAAAEVIATRFGAKLVEDIHLLAALSDPGVTSSGAGRVLRDHGMTKDRLEGLLKKNGGAKAQSSTNDDDGSALSKFAIDLTAKAKAGELDIVIGRDDEMRRILQVLTRRRKNNPVLIGPPGVGKNAIIQGLAQRIANGDVPSSLKDKRLLTLDMGSLVAGATLRGQFEERMKGVLNEVKEADGEIMLFVDEIHTMVGAGGDGASDASNLLKPALARGEIQVLGATTPDEYRNSIEKDKALERRFQGILVEETDFEQTLQILRGIKERYEVFHGVRIQDPALVSAIRFSQRYISGRHLPDKAIDLVDEAGSRLRIEIDSMPAELDGGERELTSLKMELRALDDDNDVDTREAKTKLELEIASVTERVQKIRTRWEEELSIISAMRALKEALAQSEEELAEAERKGEVERGSDIKYGSMKRLREDLAQKTAALEAVQGDTPLIREEVGPEDVAEVVAVVTGVPVSSMLESEREKLLRMESRIGKRVIGQLEGIRAIAKAIRRSRAGLNDPNRPVGSFFFLGPTGVGKTELAKAVTDFLFDDEKSLVRLDMSEFMEKHTVARLIGAPPGYKGADEGGQLTEAVRARPYSVVLFDEVEKAHPDIFNILLQILDDGRLTDSQARLVDFKNTVIIMTSNVGSFHLLEASIDDGIIEDEAKEKAMAELRKGFRPEFLGRIDEVIMFHGLTRGNIESIAEIQFGKLRKLLSFKKLQLDFEPKARDFVIDAGYEPAYGARPLRRAIQRHLQDPLSMAILEGRFEEGDTIEVFLSEDGSSVDFRVRALPIEAVQNAELKAEGKPEQEKTEQEKTEQEKTEQEKTEQEKTDSEESAEQATTSKTSKSPALEPPC